MFVLHVVDEGINMAWVWYCKSCDFKYNLDVCPKCGKLMEQYFEKICSETGDECEYEPVDDEPCYQCRIFRNRSD